MLTIVVSGNGNLTAASLQNDGQPNDASFNYFNNVGVSSSNNASVVYLGNGWAISAAHVQISNSGNVPGVRFGSTVYSIDTATPIQILTNPDGTQSDLQIFHLTTLPPLPAITSAQIPTSSLAANTRVVMIGNGVSTTGSQQYWHVSSSDGSWSPQSPPSSPNSSDFSGFNLFDGRSIRWGENQVTFNSITVQVGGTATNPIIVKGFATRFDNQAYTGVTGLTHEAQATNGDSGGGVYGFVSGQWKMVGVMIAVNQPRAQQPGGTAIFGDQTVVAELSNYRTQILAAMSSTSSSVVGRNLFYNGSTRYDTTDEAWAPLANGNDNAIAKDKSAYLPNGTGGSFTTTATFGNISSYDRGINGVMIDLAGTHGPISASDFIFKVGNNNTPSTWITAPAVATVLERDGAGANGSDRIELIWNDNDIKGIGAAGAWLEVIFKGNDAVGGNNTNSGLAASDVFFFGSMVGDTGLGDTTAAVVDNANDELHVRNNPKNLLNNIPITNVDDFNRDGQVTSTDELLARNNTNNSLTATRFLKITSPPAAPDVVSAADVDAGVGSGLTVVATTVSYAGPPIPDDSSADVAIAGNLEAELAAGRPLRDSGQFAHARLHSVWIEIDSLADDLGLDDELLDAISAGISPQVRPLGRPASR